MLTLGVETSCDDTGVALVADGALLAHQAASQADLHALFGGVVPEIASREHYRLLGPLFRACLEEAGLEPEAIEAVAVARGPGLLGSLLTGVSFAKGLVAGLGGPAVAQGDGGPVLVGVDHLQAHLLAAGLEQPLTFPAVGLLVSGGHTNLYWMPEPLALEPLGRTLDDAAGEAFDKAARALNLPYPGGAAMDMLATHGTADPALFPRAYVDNPTLDFSFSGLKTAMTQHVARHPECAAPHPLAPETLRQGREAAVAALGDRFQAMADCCASYVLAVAETLAIKTSRALEQHPETQALLLAGGVAASRVTRRLLEDTASAHGVRFIVPSPALCTDNAAMVAFLGERLAQAGRCHDLDLDAIPRGQAVPRDYLQR